MGSWYSRREEAGEYDPTSYSTGKKSGPTQAELKLGELPFGFGFPCFFFGLLGLG